MNREEMLKLAELRFFRDLVDAERMKVFKVFDALPQDFEDRISHAIQRKLFYEILAALRASAAPEEGMRDALEHLIRRHVRSWLKADPAVQLIAPGGMPTAAEQDVRDLADVILALSPDLRKVEPDTDWWSHLYQAALRTNEKLDTSISEEWIQTFIGETLVEPRDGMPRPPRPPYSALAPATEDGAVSQPSAQGKTP